MLILYIVSNPYNHLAEDHLLSPFYRRGSQDSEKLTDLLKTKQLNIRTKGYEVWHKSLIKTFPANSVPGTEDTKLMNVIAQEGRGRGWQRARRPQTTAP